MATASAIKCSHVLQSSTQATRRAAPSRGECPCACESRRQNFQENFGTASRKVGPLHLTRTYCRLVTASGIAAATTTPSHEVATTTCHSNFNRMRIREKSDRIKVQAATIRETCMRSKSQDGLNKICFYLEKIFFKSRKFNYR